MDNDKLRQRIEYLHMCFLGREPDNEADCKVEEEGNYLALIMAFQEYATRGLYPPVWVMNGLQHSFGKYLAHNENAKSHKGYKALDKFFGNLSVKSFNARADETKDYELAKRIFYYRWALGLQNSEIIKALRMDGYKINVTGKEAENPERVFERTKYTKYYDTFVKIVERDGYTPEVTAEHILETISPKARTYIEQRLKQHKK